MLLLENTRFHKEEEKNVAAFAEQMVKDTGATVFVNDAFGAAHCAHASTAGVVPYVKHAVAGLLLKKGSTPLRRRRGARPSGRSRRWWAARRCRRRSPCSSR